MLQHHRFATAAAADDPGRVHVDVERRHVVFGATRRADAHGAGQIRAEELDQQPADRVAVEPHVVDVHPVAPNRSVRIDCGGYPIATSPSAAVSTNRVEPQTKTRGPSAGREGDLAEHLRIDAPRVPGPAGRLRARQRLEDLEPVGRLVELGAVDDVLVAARRVEESRRRPASGPRPVPDHRHQRHDARAARDEQDRRLARAVPDEVAANRAADLEAITLMHLGDEIGRDLAVLELLDGDRERLSGRRRDRVAALGLVPVLGGQANVDVLTRPVTVPPVGLEDERPHPRRLLHRVHDLGGEPCQSPQ